LIVVDVAAGISNAAAAGCTAKGDAPDLQKSRKCSCWPNARW
jgi:hypothetical protein